MPGDVGPRQPRLNCADVEQRHGRDGAHRGRHHGPATGDHRRSSPGRWRQGAFCVLGLPGDAVATLDEALGRRPASRATSGRCTLVLWWQAFYWILRPQPPRTGGTGPGGTRASIAQRAGNHYCHTGTTRDRGWPPCATAGWPSLGPTSIRPLARAPSSTSRMLETFAVGWSSPRSWWPRATMTTPPSYPADGGPPRSARSSRRQGMCESGPPQAALARGDLAEADQADRALEGITRRFGISWPMVWLCLLQGRARPALGDVTRHGSRCLRGGARPSPELAFPWHLVGRSTSSAAWPRRPGDPAGGEDLHHRALAMASSTASGGWRPRRWRRWPRWPWTATATPRPPGSSVPPARCGRRRASAAGRSTSRPTTPTSPASRRSSAPPPSTRPGKRAPAQPRRRRRPTPPGPGGSASARPRGWAALTPTELEVVALAAQGLTNAEIGERLFISPARPDPPLPYLRQARRRQPRPAGRSGHGTRTRLPVAQPASTTSDDSV